ncbi:hydantoinase/oxoprolinase family protein [Phyllobacterium sp. YR531]|uniref:hydantoinase/oxoprolinase family protein n=1 Tax=Phyllobacterium sp. YR531 TaxID=1144343 RepID=UPI00026FB1D5|nr:hydantoinase/oxoprolinase family protein [Phyllobacterium sp. YR531]EJN06738.1 N-methylhydantoinase A/acetone carboxylase, beta subunit [Phyllobacterium sp. YR531]
MTLRIAIDVGGTFTDGVLLDDETGKIWLAKSLTTYVDPGNAIATVTRELLEQYGTAKDVSQVVHGTTLITNSLIERKGVKTALVTTTGMRDALDIRRELRYDTYDLGLTYPKPLVDREDRHEISARLGPDGSEWAAVSSDEVSAVAAKLHADKVGAVAVCFLHSPVSSRHEEEVRSILAEALPGVPVSISSEVSGSIGEYERMSTTVANAFVQPLVKTYLERLRSRFTEGGIDGRLDIMVSNGAFTTAVQAGEFPIRLLESGPAGGVLSAINCGMLQNADNILAFDMGGTTAKSCVAVNGRPEITHTFEFAREKRFKKGSGLPAQTPSIDLIEIGAGGGSIAKINPLGLLQVGPESAGSEPGPACYSLGGENPTVTDADLILGHLDPDGFLGGTMKLDGSKAMQALAKLGSSVGLDALETARGINEIVNENMAAAARTHIAEKGLDARRFTLIATGGAGPVHAVDVARRLRIRRVLCPIASGVGSCLGFLVAPTRADRAWSKVEAVENLDRETLAARVAAAKNEIVDEITATGAHANSINWNLCVEMRYLGQGANVEVVLNPAVTASKQELTEKFLEEYTSVFGRIVPGGIPEVVTWRVWGVSGETVRRFELGSTSRAHGEATRRSLYIPEKNAMEEVEVLQRASLPPGTKLRGPCIITEKESSLIVSHSADVQILDDGTIEVVLDEVAT